MLCRQVHDAIRHHLPNFIAFEQTYIKITCSKSRSSETGFETTLWDNNVTNMVI